MVDSNKTEFEVNTFFSSVRAYQGNPSNRVDNPKLIRERTENRRLEGYSRVQETKRRVQNRILTEMRPYQMVSLDWMLERETLESPKGEELHPLWREFVTLDGDNEATRFYFNPYNGLVSSSRYIDTSDNIR